MIDAVLAKDFRHQERARNQGLRPIIAAINDLEPHLQTLSDIDLAAKTIEFKERLAQGATLDDLLIEAFAVVREAGRRVLQYAPLRRAADRRHRPAPRQDRRNEDR